MTQTNAANRKDISAVEKLVKEWEIANAQVLTQLMSTTQGRRWMWDLISESHVFSSTMTDDPHRTAFNEGRRSVGLGLLNSVMLHCPESFTHAMREAHERHTVLTELANARAEQSGGTDPYGRDPGSTDAYDGTGFDRYVSPNDAILNN